MKTAVGLVEHFINQECIQLTGENAFLKLTKSNGLKIKQTFSNENYWM